MNTAYAVPDQDDVRYMQHAPANDDDHDYEVELKRKEAYEELHKDGWLPDDRDVSAIYAMFLEEDQGELLELAYSARCVGAHSRNSVGIRIADKLNAIIDREIAKVVV
ncbi:hypothetical protein ACT3UJ_02195 [Halomonas sp. 86]|uniref:hypothetical protein n=1 Tax=unclassified Halomonas TaxID=2609666 RepID=UPI0040349D08